MRVQKWPKFPAQKARKPFSNTRREPKNIADFRRRYERVVHPASAFETEQAKVSEQNAAVNLQHWQRGERRGQNI